MFRKPQVNFSFLTADLSIRCLEILKETWMDLMKARNHGSTLKSQKPQLWFQTWHFAPKLAKGFNWNSNLCHLCASALLVTHVANEYQRLLSSIIFGSFQPLVISWLFYLIHEVNICIIQASKACISSSFHCHLNHCARNRSSLSSSPSSTNLEIPSKLEWKPKKRNLKRRKQDSKKLNWQRKSNRSWILSFALNRAWAPRIERKT